MKRIRKDPITQLFYCPDCYQGLNTSKSLRFHRKNICKMSKPSPKIEKRITELANKLVNDYSELKQQGVHDDQLKIIIQRMVPPADITALRTHFEEAIANDTKTITSYSEQIRIKMNESWIYNQRIAVEDDTLDSELKKLNTVTDPNLIKELLEFHRTACMILQKNLIRLSQFTADRQFVYQVVNNMMPAITKLPSDLI